MEAQDYSHTSRNMYIAGPYLEALRIAASRLTKAHGREVTPSDVLYESIERGLACNDKIADLSPRLKQKVLG